ncbi:MAG: ANTAR domain-containing protein [Gammaproteobacteria bacterium]|jgi:AmiR/NasT family two-component response regulator|nr:ANTAR domain-containing protein [Gammaproteobacteria bacterium]
MMRPRLLQNFRGVRASLLSAPGGANEALEPVLLRLGLSVARIEPPAMPDLANLLPERDVIFADADLGPELGAMLCPGGEIPPVAVIGLTDSDAPSRLKLLMDVGATATLRKPVHPSAVYSALFLSINQFRGRRDLQARLAEHERRRQGRRFLIKAVARLMHECGLSDDAAYDLLRRQSMWARQTLEQYCEAWLTAAERPDQGRGTTGKGETNASNITA